MQDESSQIAETRLVDRARAGDMEAFDELVMIHQARIYGLLVRMVRNEEDALDLTQETFVRAWKALPRLGNSAPFVSWLLRIATNAGIDWLRKERRGRPKPEEPSADQGDPRQKPEEASMPQDTLVDKERQNAVRRAINRLSPEHRAVILLKELEELSHKEIADKLGCSVGTVMSRLFYARRQLRENLKEICE